MNIVIRKLVFNESEIHIILWKDKPCFLVSELSKALDSVNKEDIPVFLRYGGNAIKGVDYDVIAGGDARDLRSYLENSGIKKRFAHTMIIYFDGLRKYFNYRKTIESKDFISYLEKSKISLDADSIAPVGAFGAAAKDEANEKPAAPVAEAKPKAIEKPIPAAVEKPTPTAAAERKTTAPKREPAAASASSAKPGGYSELVRQLNFMEDFVDAFNKIKIPPEKSAAFTKSMAKFLEDNGVQPNVFLQEIKKWIV